MYQIFLARFHFIHTAQEMGTHLYVQSKERRKAGRRDKSFHAAGLGKGEAELAEKAQLFKEAGRISWPGAALGPQEVLQRFCAKRVGAQAGKKGAGRVHTRLMQTQTAR